MIRSGELRPGSPLPPQRELAAGLDVSRASLREALSVLGTLGLLRTEPRRGTFVVDRGELDGQAVLPWRYAARYSPLEVYQFRFVTEGYAARLAAIHMTEAELGVLRQNLSDLKESVRAADLVASSQLDFDFHRQVMVYSRNRVLADLYGSYGAVLLESQRLPLAWHERRWEPVAEHENILRAMEKRDPDGAVYFMHVHVIRAASRIGIAMSDAA